METLIDSQKNTPSIKCFELGYAKWYFPHLLIFLVISGQYLIITCFSVDSFSAKMEPFYNWIYINFQKAFIVKIVLLLKSITLVNKNFAKAIEVSYFPNFGSLIPNPAIIIKSLWPIVQCCQFRGFSVENYIFEIISKF